MDGGYSSSVIAVLLYPIMAAMHVGRMHACVIVLRTRTETWIGEGLKWEEWTVLIDRFHAGVKGQGSSGHVTLVGLHCMLVYNV